MENLATYKVNEEHTASLETPFTYEEYTTAVKELKNGSCPGNDGLPIEVYKCFWKYLHEDYIKAMESVFASEKMYTSAKSGVLNLIPKKNKDVRQLKNLRPITLLNSDYKILEKCIANRMTPALQGHHSC